MGNSGRWGEYRPKWAKGRGGRTSQKTAISHRERMVVWNKEDVRRAHLMDMLEIKEFI